MPEGKKYDEGKNRLGLVLGGFSDSLWEVSEIGTFGATKYGPNNWMNLSDAYDRYLDALLRHLFQHLQGEKIDSESGKKHLAHATWNALALLHFEILKDKNELP